MFQWTRVSTYVIMAINAACHTMMDLAADHCWIGVRTNLKTGNAVIVHVIPFIITLKNKDANIFQSGR